MLKFDLFQMMPTRRCVKTMNLRKENLNFVEWWFKSNAVYIGDNLNIHLQDDEIQESIWKNPFNYHFSKGLMNKDTVLKSYEQHVRHNLWEELDALDGCELGCFCDSSQRCHGDVLISLYNEKVNSNKMDIPETWNCTICLMKPRNMIMLPCLHLCICQDCSQELIRKRIRKCPICRKTVVMKKIYIS